MRETGTTVRKTPLSEDWRLIAALSTSLLTILIRHPGLEPQRDAGK